MRFLRRSLVGVFLLSATLALLVWAGNTVRGAVQDRMNQEARSFPQRERTFAVNVITIAPQDIAPVLSAFGEVRAARTLDMRSAVGGTVTAAAPELVEGGVVAAGQVLLVIDPTTAQAALDRAMTDVQDAQAEWRDAERAIVLAQDDLNAARAQAELRDTALARAQDLQARGVGTAAAVETAELAASSAQAAVLSRRQSLAQAEGRLDQAQTRLARAEIAQSEAARTVADTTITAAFDGVVSDVTVAPGGRVTANERFAQLVDPSQLEIAFRVSTAQYARLLDSTGNLGPFSVRAGLDVAGVGLTASGVLVRESAVVAAGQTGRLLFARLDQAAGFRPGDFVTVGIDEPVLSGVALVPAAAVGADGMVLVLGDDDRLGAAPAKVLRLQGDDVIIETAGLAGARIVAERSPLLGAGIKVTPIAPAGEGLAAAPAAPEMIALDAERRARLVAFVTDSRMPDDAKARILSQLEAEEVPAATIERLESRMGG